MIRQIIIATSLLVGIVNAKHLPSQLTQEFATTWYQTQVMPLSEKDQMQFAALLYDYLYAAHYDVKLKKELIRCEELLTHAQTAPDPEQSHTAFVTLSAYVDRLKRFVFPQQVLWKARWEKTLEAVQNNPSVPFGKAVKAFQQVGQELVIATLHQQRDELRTILKAETLDAIATSLAEKIPIVTDLFFSNAAEKPFAMVIEFDDAVRLGVQLEQEAHNIKQITTSLKKLAVAIEVTMEQFLSLLFDQCNDACKDYCTHLYEVPETDVPSSENS